MGVSLVMKEAVHVWNVGLIIIVDFNDPAVIVLDVHCSKVERV